MSKQGKTGASLAAVGLLSLAFMTLGMPMLVLAGWGGSSDPLGADAGLNAEGLPPVAAAAYEAAADTARRFEPPCEIPVWLLAGVGEIESGHGTSGGATIASDGAVAPPIVGPPLPHLGADTDRGEFDGSRTVDHAVGPMQFIPSTWRAYGMDGNQDGIADPHNIYDAALTAATYLCTSGGPMATEADWRRGLLAYNRSSAYADDVLGAAYSYRLLETHTIANVTGGPVQLVDIRGIGLTNASWAPQVRAMLAAAEADGVHLTGSSYRDTDEQIALRRAHCGTSHYAIYEMPAGECRPPTARPGNSNHERGLAIDFDRCANRTTVCYRWLATNASAFDLVPLNSESWHWSIDGR